MKILITGANRGLGLYLTKIGLEHNHHVIAGVRHTGETATKELTNLQSLSKSQLEIVQLDVKDEESVKRAAETVRAEEGSLDSIINNAGILAAREQSIEELDLEACKQSFDINTLGPIRVIKHFLPLLKKGDMQSIINVSSEAASLTNAYSGDYPYGMSKVSVNMFSEKLHAYLSAENIQVLSVHPGWMQTDIGGTKAPTDPHDTAKGIYKMIERKVNIDSKYVFVDYEGKPMAI